MNNLRVGQKIHCILYGGMNGIIYKIEGWQSPESVRSLGGGCVVMGGTAQYCIVFDDGHKSMVPEAIVRGVQWRIKDEYATPQEIEQALIFCEASQIKDKRLAELKAQVRAEQKAQILKANPDLIQGQYAAVGSKNMKKELKKAFPSTKFSVTSDHGSIRVKWIDGPTESQVKAITSKYEYGSFDGMTDSYDYDEDRTWSDTFGGAKYVFENRELSYELKAKAVLNCNANVTLDQWGNFDAKERGDFHWLNEWIEQNTQAI